MSLINWNKNNVLKFSVDHTLVDEDLVDFPMLLNITESSGINGFNCSELFTELDYTMPETYFSGTTINKDLWVVYSEANLVLNNEELTVANTSWGAVYSKFFLDGDFDVEVELHLLVWPNINSWQFVLAANYENNGANQVYVNRYFHGKIHQLA
jgi:hypothetical protein